MDDQILLIAGCVVSFLFLGGVYTVLLGFTKDDEQADNALYSKEKFLHKKD